MDAVSLRSSSPLQICKFIFGLQEGSCAVRNTHDLADVAGVGINAVEFAFADHGEFSRLRQVVCTWSDAVVMAFCVLAAADLVFLGGACGSSAQLCNQRGNYRKTASVNHYRHHQYLRRSIRLAVASQTNVW